MRRGMNTAGVTLEMKTVATTGAIGAITGPWQPQGDCLYREVSRAGGGGGGRGITVWFRQLFILKLMRTLDYMEVCCAR